MEHDNLYLVTMYDRDQKLFITISVYSPPSTTKSISRKFVSNNLKICRKKLLIKKVIRKLAGKSIAKIKKYRGGGGPHSKSDKAAHTIDESRFILYNNAFTFWTTIEYYGCEKILKVGSVQFIIVSHSIFINRKTRRRAIWKN